MTGRRLSHVAIVAVFAVACSADKISVSPVDDSVNSSQPAKQSIDELGIVDAELQVSTTTRTETECLTDPQLWSFDTNVPIETYSQSASLEELVARSPLIVGGQLIQQSTYTTEGTALQVKLFGAFGALEYDRARIEWIWVPEKLSDTGILGDSFVAFLSGEEFHYTYRYGSYLHTASAWVVNPKGLWIWCDRLATSIGAGPDGTPQQAHFDDSMTWDELWNAVSTSGQPVLDLYWLPE